MPFLPEILSLLVDVDVQASSSNSTRSILHFVMANTSPLTHSKIDFSGGDPGTAYDSISQRLFTLPRDTVVWPSHDYRYNTSSTVGVEMDTNPR